MAQEILRANLGSKLVGVEIEGRSIWAQLGPAKCLGITWAQKSWPLISKGAASSPIRAEESSDPSRVQKYLGPTRTEKNIQAQFETENRARFFCFCEFSLVSTTRNTASKICAQKFTAQKSRARNCARNRARKCFCFFIDFLSDETLPRRSAPENSGAQKFYSRRKSPFLAAQGVETRMRIKYEIWGSPNLLIRKLESWSRKLAA